MPGAAADARERIRRALAEGHDGAKDSAARSRLAMASSASRAPAPSRRPGWASCHEMELEKAGVGDQPGPARGSANQGRLGMLSSGAAILALGGSLLGTVRGVSRCHRGELHVALSSSLMPKGLVPAWTAAGCPGVAAGLLADIYQWGHVMSGH